MRLFPKYTYYIFYFLPFFLLHKGNYALSQKAVIKITTENDFTPIVSTLPLFNNYIQLLSEEIYFSKDRYLSHVIDSLNTSCFATIKYGEQSQIHLIVEPNDTIFIEFKSKTPKKSLEWVDFKGNKGELHKILNKEYLTLYSNSKSLKNFLGDKKPESFNDFFIKLGIFLDNRLLQIDSLCKKYRATDDFKRIVCAAVINNVIGGIETNINDYFFDNSNIKSVQIHDELRVYVYERFQNILTPYLNKVPLGITNYQKYLWQTEGSKLDNSNDQSLILPISDGWQGLRADNIFPEELQPSNWAFQMVCAAKYFPNVWDMNLAYKKYCNRYPNSPYIPILKRRLRIEEINTTVEYSIIDSASVSNNFVELMKNNLSGNQGFVFVDLWATWCSGCKTAFKEYKNIMPFFKENRIKCLFISIDEKSKKTLWKRLVDGFMMEGYHTLANSQFQEFLEKKVFKGEVKIPQYLLIDSQGKIIKQFDNGMNDLPLLKEKIRKLL